MGPLLFNYLFPGFSSSMENVIQNIRATALRHKYQDDSEVSSAFFSSLVCIRCTFLLPPLARVSGTHLLFEQISAS